MLLEFKVKNYKSFKEEMTFKMQPKAKQKGLDYSILKDKILGKEVRGLSSAVIYGPNASGKSNIIGAMDTLRSIILRGNIRNSKDKNNPNNASNNLELIPNNTLAKSQPVSFSIKFIEENLLFEYLLVIDLGCFLDDEYKRNIKMEKLIINNYTLYERGETLIFNNLIGIEDLLNNEFEKNSKVAINLVKSNLNREELFLTNSFKNIVSSKIANLITNWMEYKFMVIYRADSMHLIEKFSKSKIQTVYINHTINDVARLFGINSNNIGYVVERGETEAKMCSIFDKDTKSNKNVAISAELFESYGTVRFLNMFPIIVRAIRYGGTLVIDEFDASLHPMALMSIVNIFHNDDINRKNAQLIFNTHNPIFLNSNMFRRDEIKFVEREDNAGFSRHYSLSDFGTSGDKGVRLHEDYMKNYFISQYGAIQDIDFTPFFEHIINEEGGEV